MATASDLVTVHCKGCGEPRALSPRQARRAGLCNRCLFPPNVSVKRAHLRYWLRTFTDQEIAAIASDFVERTVPVARIRQQRAVLTASSRRRQQ
jgi:hypothetical protein